MAASRARGDVASMVLVPLVCSSVDVPVIAAGGICDGRTMAAAFALGAEGRADGHAAWCRRRSRPSTTTTSSSSSTRPRPAPCSSTGSTSPASGCWPRPTARSASRATSRCRWPRSTGLFSLYFGGDLDAAFAFGGQVAGRIDAVKPVAQIIDETMAEFHDTLQTLAARYACVNDRLPALEGLRVLEAVGGHRGRVRGKAAARPGRRRGEAGALRRWRSAAQLVGGNPRPADRVDRRAVRVPARGQGQRDRHRHGAAGNTDRVGRRHRRRRRRPTS